MGKFPRWRTARVGAGRRGGLASAGQRAGAANCGDCGVGQSCRLKGWAGGLRTGFYPSRVCIAVSDSGFNARLHGLLFGKADGFYWSRSRSHMGIYGQIWGHIVLYFDGAVG